MITSGFFYGIILVAYYHINLSSINNLDGALSKTVKIIDLSFRQSEVWATRNPNRLRFLLILYSE